MSPELPPRPGLGLLKRALLASLAIVLMSAGAVSAAGLLTADTLINDLEKAGELEGRKVIPVEKEIDRADAGDPRTIMVLGSDARYGADKRDRRADTIILVRLDPDKDATTIMSIPRDLKVRIPGYQYEDRINAAFSSGGAKLTLKTVKELLSTPEQPFEINHVIQIDFAGFRRAVDFVGCVYVDIDRDYFNDVSGPNGYATIDIDAGYQKLCGRDSLDYVRYRHTDNDLVRAARQQDFLRQLKGQAGVREKLTFDNRREIVKIIGRYTDTDRALHEKKTLFSLLRLGIFTADKPIEEVQFGDGRLQDEGGVYLRASEDAIRATVDDFLNARTPAGPKAELEPTEEEAKDRKRRSKKRRPSKTVPGMEEARKEGEDMAIVASTKLDFPFYFPTLRPSGARYSEAAKPRLYKIRDETGKKHDAYRISASLGVAGEYYGIQGMSWRYPPILDGPHDTRRVNGRKFMVYYDGRRVRLVAWRTKRGLYYVSNTLVRTLPARKMIALASSLRRLGG